MFGARCGTLSSSISMPVPARAAVSQVEQVKPAAPMSWMPATAPVASSSRQASHTSFSMNGSPTCTAPRCCSADSSVKSCDANAAPARPSRPVGRTDVKNRIADALWPRRARFVRGAARRGRRRSRADCLRSSCRNKPRPRWSGCRSNCRNARCRPRRRQTSGVVLQRCVRF